MALTVVLVSTAGLQARPAAAAVAFFAVMNTSESPPDGVWFRTNPVQGDTDHVTGHGVYAGDVMAVDCYKFGEAVGAYGNRVWYRGSNLTRPRVPTGAPNVGYMNTHYVNDGMVANQVYTGIPECDVAPAPPPPTPLPLGNETYFYKPTTNPSRGAPAPAVNFATGTWEGGASCSPEKSYSLVKAKGFDSFANVRLSGWSLGRMGPVYFLGRASNAELAKVDSVVMVDPGSNANMTGGCDVAYQSGQRIARWLNVNRTAQLVVLSGKDTAKNAHKGIQEVWFNAVRDAERITPGLTDRITVCNYGGSDDRFGRTMHEKMIDSSKGLLNLHPFPVCPTLRDVTYQGAWNP